MKVNGKDRAVPAEGTVLGLLNELGHDPQRVAVEKNGTIIPRAQFAEEKLTVQTIWKSYASWAAAVPFGTNTVWCEGDILRKTQDMSQRNLSAASGSTHFLLV